MGHVREGVCGILGGIVGIGSLETLGAKQGKAPSVVVRVWVSDGKGVGCWVLGVREREREGEKEEGRKRKE